MEKLSAGEICQAKENEALLEDLIRTHETFILQCASKAVNHYVTKSHDEYSIALMAFHEAVKSFDEGKGDFHAFASLVIKRRLLDKLKSDYRRQGEILVDSSSMSGDISQEEDPSALQLSIQEQQAKRSEETPDPDSTPGTTPVQDEIEAVSQLLNRYGFFFHELIECSPKAGKTKNVCAESVTCLLENSDLFNKMRKSKSLPMKEILEKTKLPRKILERHRKYIIAATEILKGDYPQIGEYLRYIKDYSSQAKGGKKKTGIVMFLIMLCRAA